MDTLIDNRNFPIEMQDSPEPVDGKSTPWLLILLVVVALGILAYLAYMLFSPKEAKEELVVPNTIPVEQKVKVVENFKASKATLTAEERQKKINTFFNN